MSCHMETVRTDVANIQSGILSGISPQLAQLNHEVSSTRETLVGFRSEITSLKSATASNSARIDEVVQSVSSLRKSVADEQLALKTYVDQRVLLSSRAPSTARSGAIPSLAPWAQQVYLVPCPSFPGNFTSAGGVRTRKTLPCAPV